MVVSQINSVSNLVSFLKFCSCLFFLFIYAGTAFAQADTDKISIRATKITETLYMLDCVDGFGGGNILASVGVDGVLLVDAMYASMSAKIEQTMRKLSDEPLKILVNTHYHRDHSEGSKNFGKYATVIAHHKAIDRMKSNATAEAFPAVSVYDYTKVRFNGDEIRLLHYPRSHTDGDLVVYFENAKVLHMGDMFFVGMFPAVYKAGGGDIKQLIRSLGEVLAFIPEDTKIVPGHGPLASVEDLRKYVVMLEETTKAVEVGLKQGKTLNDLEKDPAILKYSSLGEGGAQTLQQYVNMLVGLLSDL